MISVEFHNTVDDSLLKFAVILSRYQGNGCFASIGIGIPTSVPEAAGKQGKR